MVLEALRLGYNASVPQFNKEEILANVGLAYGGHDTLLSQIRAYSNYVILPVGPRVAPFGLVKARAIEVHDSLQPTLPC